MKQKKRRSLNYPDAFSQAWEHEMNRYLFGSVISPLDLSAELGNEFHWFKKSKKSVKKEKL